MTASSGEVPAAPPEARKETCTRYFDDLWFCYSPVFQTREYYTYGHLDDCLSHWGRLYDCLKRRTKFKESAEPAPAPAPGIWEKRTKAEAKAFWDAEFGHLWGQEGAPPDGSPDGSRGGTDAGPEGVPTAPGAS